MLTRRAFLVGSGALLLGVSDPMIARRLLMAGKGHGPFKKPGTVPPFDDSWTVYGVVIDLAAGEPSVMHENDTFKLWGAGGSVGAEALGYWTSTNGTSWTSVGDVLGQGHSGVAGVVIRASVAKFGSTYHAYYSDTTGASANLCHATSSDGTTWTGHGTVIANNAQAGWSGWANSTVWQEGTTWHMLLEGWNTTGVDNWRIAALTSTDGTSWTFENGGNPVSGMEIVANGSYGGPSVACVGNVQTPKFGGLYHVWAHCQSTGSNVPTPTYHFTSSDRITWTETSPNPVLSGLPQAGHTWDQTSDPQVLVAHGTAYLYYGGVDNSDYLDYGLGLATAPATY